MKEIIIKEIDKLTSKLHKSRQISEYLIYLTENDVKLACYNEIGCEAKNIRVNELVLENFQSLSTENIIKEIKFEEIIKI